MRVDILGARGSTPATGHQFTRYGGDTSSIAISHHDASAPTLILDAGTGLKNLEELVTPFVGTILLTHLHWDHTHGLPFSKAVDHPESRVRLLLPAQGLGAEELLARVLGPPHFPITPGELKGEWTFEVVDVGSHNLEGFEILAEEVIHKGGRTFGFRVGSSGSSLAYIPDHSHGHNDGSAVDRLTAGVDLLFHDSQDIAVEWPAASDYGHSTVEQTVELGVKSCVGKTLLFHHSPGRTDGELDRIVDAIGIESVVAAAQGDTLTI